MIRMGRWTAVAVIVAMTAALGIGSSSPAATAEKAVVLPAPAADNPKAPGPPQTAVIAGGCFWGVQGVYQHVRGVQRAVSGYSGGTKATADYQAVSGGGTGHAEAVQIIFDPGRSPTARSCRSTSRSSTIRRNSIGRDPTWARSIGRTSSTPTRRRRRSPRPTSPSSRRRRPSAGRSSRGWIRWRVLSGRGLPPGLPRQESAPAVHRHPRPSEGRELQEGLSRPLPRAARHRRSLEVVAPPATRQDLGAVREPRHRLSEDSFRPLGPARPPEADRRRPA